MWRRWLGLAAAMSCVCWADAVWAAKGKAARREEIHGRTIETTFKQADANKDGKLSLDEYKSTQWNAKDPEADFKAMDKDHDGSLTLKEFTAGWEKKEPAASGSDKKAKKGKNNK